MFPVSGVSLRDDKAGTDKLRLLPVHLRPGSLEKIIAEFSQIRGVGVWTAEMTMIRGMQKFDAFPGDDIGLRRIIAHYYYDGEKITGEEVRRTAAAWAGWRGLASFYLVMAEQLKIIV